LLPNRLADRINSVLATMTVERHDEPKLPFQKTGRGSIPRS
jgi:hypothetical protein